MPVGQHPGAQGLFGRVRGVAGVDPGGSAEHQLFGGGEQHLDLPGGPPEAFRTGHRMTEVGGHPLVGECVEEGLRGPCDTQVERGEREMEEAPALLSCSAAGPYGVSPMTCSQGTSTSRNVTS